jgi:hypothetical protein
MGLRDPEGQARDRLSSQMQPTNLLSAPRLARHGLPHLHFSHPHASDETFVAPGPAKTNSDFIDGGQSFPTLSQFAIVGFLANFAKATPAAAS